MQKTFIAPSLLSADILNLGKEIEAIQQAGADLIHIDIMDGHFVPNLTFGPSFVQQVKKIAQLPLDVHLMIEDVDDFIPIFAKNGADIITIHPEAGPHLHRSLSLIRSLEKKAGVALNPATPVETIIPILPFIDQVLVMTVNPGFSGQEFIPQMLTKIQQLKNHIYQDELNIVIEVDGGITVQNAPSVIEAGADILVAGTTIFSSNNYKETIEQLRTKS